MTNKSSSFKKNRHQAFIYFFLGCFALFIIDGKGNAKQEFYSPFGDSNRKSFSSIKSRLVGLYGEYRKSYKPGHLHAGVDLEGSFNETIYAVSRGQVQLIFHDFPHKTVVVKHQQPDGRLQFSVYTHVEDIQVDVGEWVDEQTSLARLFNEDELKRANFGTPNHLHFEIRKSMADDGRASYASMTKDELNKFCMDPMEFFKTNLEK